MKKLILVSMMVLMCSPIVWADDDQCAIVAETANLVMTLRQGNVPLKRVLDLAAIDNSGDTLKFMRMVTLDAYDEPLWATKVSKEQAVIMFENKWYRMCIDQNFE